MAWTHTRSAIARTIKANPDADTTELRSQLKAERLEAAIAEKLATAPPLTDSQRERLANLLRPRTAAAPADGGGRDAA